ncbi:MAG: hypothetical protein OJF49_001210 [Ktedonobacterales bacterium]|nr:MAG: hypothetical protein OJF49_001210 [Ktedonobacterales bacterium]
MPILSLSSRACSTLLSTASEYSTAGPYRALARRPAMVLPHYSSRDGAAATHARGARRGVRWTPSGAGG